MIIFDFFEPIPPIIIIQIIVYYAVSFTLHALATILPYSFCCPRTFARAKYLQKRA